MCRLYVYKNRHYFSCTSHICVIFISICSSLCKTIHHYWHYRITHHIRVHRSNKQRETKHSQNTHTTIKKMVVITIHKPNYSFPLTSHLVLLHIHHCHNQCEYLTHLNYQPMVSSWHLSLLCRKFYLSFQHGLLNLFFGVLIL